MTQFNKYTEHLYFVFSEKRELENKLIMSSSYDHARYLSRHFYSSVAPSGIVAHRWSCYREAASGTSLDREWRMRMHRCSVWRIVIRSPIMYCMYACRAVEWHDLVHVCTYARTCTLMYTVCVLSTHVYGRPARCTCAACHVNVQHDMCHMSHNDMNS